MGTSSHRRQRTLNPAGLFRPSRTRPWIVSFGGSGTWLRFLGILVRLPQVETASPIRRPYPVSVCQQSRNRAQKRKERMRHTRRSPEDLAPRACSVCRACSRPSSVCGIPNEYFTLRAFCHRAGASEWGELGHRCSLGACHSSFQTSETQKMQRQLSLSQVRTQTTSRQASSCLSGPHPASRQVTRPRLHGVALDRGRATLCVWGWWVGLGLSDERASKRPPHERPRPRR